MTPSRDPRIPVDPHQLGVKRSDRYDGRGFDVSSQAFAPDDAEALRTLHDRCQDVYETWLEVRDGGDWDALDGSALIRSGTSSRSGMPDATEKPR